MRKTYIAPSISVFAEEAAQYLLAGSVMGIAVENEEFNAEKMTPLSRENSLWGDEE